MGKRVFVYDSVQRPGLVVGFYGFYWMVLKFDCYFFVFTVHCLFMYEGIKRETFSPF